MPAAIVLVLLLSGCAGCWVSPLPVGPGGPLLHWEEYLSLYRDGLDRSRLDGAMIGAICRAN